MMPPRPAPSFARLTEYLRELPDGLASHPSCATKASLYRQALSDKPLDAVVDSLPAEVAALVRAPLPVNAWAPAAPVQALFVAIADAYEMDDDQFQAWSHRQQRTLLSGPLYRVLTMVASPTALLNGARMRWGSFHRGSDIDVDVDVDVEPGGDKRGRLRLHHPPHLFARTNLRGFAGGLSAIASLSRARDCAITLTAMTPTEATFHFSWR